MTLPHESIMGGSAKKFFRIQDVVELAERKHDAGLSKDIHQARGEPKSGYVRFYKKQDYKPHLRTRKNWYDYESMPWRRAKVTVYRVDEPDEAKKYEK